MSRIVSDRAGKTDQVLVLPSSLEDSKLAPPGTYRIFLWSLLGSIFAFFAALMSAYVLRAQAMQFWNPLPLPRILWVSTMVIALSSMTFEFARQFYGRGLRRVAHSYLLATLTLGVVFLACQISAWRELVHRGAYMLHNPHGTFFYLFTGLHAAHLVGGLIALLVVVLGHNKRREFVNAVCYYWHFLGVLWLALFEMLRWVA